MAKASAVSTPAPCLGGSRERLPGLRSLQRLPRQMSGGSRHWSRWIWLSLIEHCAAARTIKLVADLGATGSARHKRPVSGTRSREPVAANTGLSEIGRTPAHHAAIPDPPHTRADMGHGASRPRTTRTTNELATPGSSAPSVDRSRSMPECRTSSPCREVLAIPAAKTFGNPHI